MAEDLYSGRKNKSSKSPERDSNPGPPDCESDVLTTRPRCLHKSLCFFNGAPNTNLVFFRVAWENSRYFATRPLVSSRKVRRIPNWWRVTTPDLGSASDWSWCEGILLKPIRSTTQVWVATCHRYGICTLVAQTSFREETSGSVAKCQLFSQAE